MANELINPVVIAQETLMRLENNLTMSKFCDRQYDDRFAVENEKIGFTFNARVPVRFRGRRGDGIKVENIQETTIPISINQLWGQDLQIGDQDLTLTIDHFGDRYIESQAQTVANMIDGDGLLN